MNLTGTRYPLVQAPMAGVQGSALAAAVCQAGALGSLPAALLSPAALDAELRELGARHIGPININFFCHRMAPPDAAQEAAWRNTLAPYYAEFGLDPNAVSAGPVRKPFDVEMAQVLQVHRPAIVSFHFGLPDEALLRQLKAWGAQVWSSATTVEEALWLQAHGADAVIAQGLEAGGHRGSFLSSDDSRQLGTLALVPQVVRALRVPVIAAGGIAGAAGVRAALALGAHAVQVGTAFLLCEEATTTAVHRAALQSPQAAHTALTRLFSGRPARGIVNRLMRELGPMNAAAPEFPWASSALQPLRAHAEAQGLSDFTPLWCGQNASGCDAVKAAVMVQRLMAR